MPGHLTDNASHTRNSKRCNPTHARGVVLEKENTKMVLLPSVWRRSTQFGKPETVRSKSRETRSCIKGAHDESESNRGKGNYRQHAWVRRPRTGVGRGERRTPFAERAADTVATRWPWPRTRARRRLGRRRLGRRRRRLGRQLGWAWLGRRAWAIRLRQRSRGLGLG